MTWFMEILKMYLEEQLLIKHCVIKYLILLKTQNMMDVKGFSLQWLIGFLTAGGAVKNEIMQNKELPEELHKPIITIFEKQKVHSSCIDNICGTKLADMQLISHFNKGQRNSFFLCVIGSYGKHATIISLKD